MQEDSTANQRADSPIISDEELAMKEKIMQARKQFGLPELPEWIKELESIN